MKWWTQISQILYYTGAGIVLIGTGIRYLFRRAKRNDMKDAFLMELREIHLTNIYNALEQIAKELNIRLDIKLPGVDPS